MATERCWELAYPVTYDILRDRRLGLVALAAVDTRDLGRRRQGAERAAVAAVGWLPRASVPLVAIGGYYGEPLGIDRRGDRRSTSERGLAGMKFKVGGAHAREIDAKRVRGSDREAAGDDFVLTIDANQGYTVGGRAGVRVAGSRTLGHPVVRGTGALAQRPPGAA